MTPGSAVLKKFVLRDPLGITNLALRKLQSFQIDENYRIDQGYVVTRDYRNLILFVSPARSAQETLRNKELLKTIGNTAKTISHHFDNTVQTTYFGAPAVAVDNATRIRKDVTLTITVAMIFLCLLIGFFFQRFSVFFLIIIPTLLGAATAFALLYLFKGQVSLIAIGVGSILIGITLDYSLHVFTHYRSTGNIRRVIYDLTVPILMSSLTTAAAFLCLYFVRSDALHDMGLFAALSVAAAAVFSLVVLPMFLSKKNGNITSPRHNILDRIAAWPMEKSRIVLICIVALSLFCLLHAFDVQFEDDLYKINYMSDEVRAAEEHLNSITSASMQGIYIATHGKTLDEALLRNEQVRHLADSLKRSGAIKTYTCINNVLQPIAQQEKKIAYWKSFWTADRQNKVKTAIARAATKVRFRADAFSGFYTTLYTDYKAQNVSVFDPLVQSVWKDFISQREGMASILTLLRLKKEDKANVYAALENATNINILDKEFMVSRFVSILKDDFDKLVLFSLLLVFIILHLSYGRIELAVIAFAPILLSWIWTLGLMNLFGLKFNIVNIIITTFVFGLGIDYSIFVMRGLLQEYKYGVRNLSSYKTSILLSGLTTLTGIGVLIFAQHPALKSIASLSVIGISSVILLCFAIEPLMFRWLFYDYNGQRREYPRTLYNTVKTLYVYGLLALGSIVISIFGGGISLLRFIGKERRKYILHWAICQFYRFYLWISFFPNRQTINVSGEDFSRSAVIISNHQSHIDTPIMLSFHPKTIILTKKWVYRFPLYHYICRLADYFTVADGIDPILPKMKERTDNNYSICVFPEGSRSATDKVNRFHKGAFYIAQALQLDIIPVYLHGTGRFLRKNVLWGQSNDITIKIGTRIKPNDARFGTGYAERTKRISWFYKQQYREFEQERKTPRYYRRQLLENYLYKGPVLEWYARVKFRLENYYATFDELVPREGTITDIGCGYGFMAYMLFFLSEDRTIIGIDYDKEKINVANHCAAKTDRLQFIYTDIIHHVFANSDVFLLADVLHYLPTQEQNYVLQQCIENLNAGGSIIIRDGDRDLQKRHTGTRLTETFSTNLGFNKTRNRMQYISSTELEKWATEHGCSLKRIDNTLRTSNIIFVLKKTNLYEKI